MVRRRSCHSTPSSVSRRHSCHASSVSAGPGSQPSRVDLNSAVLFRPVLQRQRQARGDCGRFEEELLLLSCAVLAQVPEHTRHRPDDLHGHSCALSQPVVPGRFGKPLLGRGAGRSVTPCGAHTAHRSRGGRAGRLQRRSSHQLLPNLIGMDRSAAVHCSSMIGVAAWGTSVLVVSLLVEAFGNCVRNAALSEVAAVSAGRVRLSARTRSGPGARLAMSGPGAPLPTPGSARAGVRHIRSAKRFGRARKWASFSAPPGGAGQRAPPSARW